MNESTQLANVVISRLLAHGVTDVVLAPGSRSTPLALGLAQAERRGDLALHVRIDERSAGFLAVGIAKITRRPVAVVCTSGTAVANLAPAVVEAAYTGLPLVAVTADRPPELRGVGANQTIDQVGFFGQQVRTAVDLLALPQDAHQPATWRKVVDRVLADALGIGHSGPAPVQLNVGFREPMVPDAVDDIALDPTDPLDTSVPAPIREPINFAVADLGLNEVPARGVVVVGDVPDSAISAQAVDLADACGWPLISEPSGNALCGQTGVPSASVFLADEQFRSAHAPDLVITIGRFGLSRPVMRLVGSAAHHLAVHVGGKDRPDPLRTAAVVLGAVPRPPEDDPLIPLAPPDGQWLRDWLIASAAAQTRISTAIAVESFTGLAVAATCWASAEADDLIFAASSRTVRNFEAAMTVRHYPPRVVGNRGASGIDGLVSTAWGAGLAHGRTTPGGRTIAVVGDLAFLHDHNGLLAPATEPRPNLTIVVADNNGGGIFSSLEQGAAEFDADFERVFGTPHDRDLAAVAAAAGSPTVTVTSAAELAAALDDRSVGVTIIIATTASREEEQRQWANVLPDGPIAR